MTNADATVSGLTIRELTDVESMALVEALQLEIWGYGAEGEDRPYPCRALFGFASSGGLVALAVLNGEPAGFSAAWVGREPRGGHCYLQSQLVGVLPQCQGRGIGLALKLHQREFALRSGLDHIRWTFDPLRSVNARLNLVRLGALCVDYREDYYGKLRSRFSREVPSDRLWAEWYISSPRVRLRLDAANGAPLSSKPRALPTAFDSAPLPEFPALRAVAGEVRRLEAPKILVEIPLDYAPLELEFPAQAWEWRLHVRAALGDHLQRGYVVSDLISWEETDTARTFLCLTRASVEELLASAE